ncbi:glycosyltransferase [Anaerovibrio slackiae]|uniref:glycosyltransferase n=1 Tax=Anaerovibrio slackiae TaxID=2652309 RepID=UPI003F17686D
MKIMMDLQGFQSESSHNRGIGRYSLYLSQAIERQLDEGDSLISLLNNSYKKEIVEYKKIKSRAEKKYFYIPSLNCDYGISNDCSKDVAAKLLEYTYNFVTADANLIFSPMEGFIGNAIVPKEIPRESICAVILYDLIPLIFRDIYLSNPALENWYMGRMEFIKKADIVFTISEATRTDAIKYLQLSEDKVVNILGSVDNIFKPIKEKTTISNMLLEYGIQKRFILYTGGIDYRKNINRLIGAFSKVTEKIKDDIQLVIVCSILKEDKKSLLRLAEERGLKDGQVVFTGFVSDNDLVALYNLCELFVFPSIYEGLGMPIIEAMKCGAPVIGANNSSIAEIIERKEALFDGYDVDDMAGKISEVLTDEELRIELKKYSLKRSADFDWDKSARIVLNTLKSAVDKKKNNPVTVDVKRMAYLSPLPPDKSGIAYYSEDILLELKKYFKIDLFSDIARGTNLVLDREFNIYQYEDFPKLVEDYDVVIYQMGNSDFHRLMYDYIQKYPGIVVLHDFYISGLLNYMSCVEQKDYMMEALQYSHGISRAKELNLNGREACLWKYPMNKKILDSSLGVIFHSKYAFDLYKAFYHQKIDFSKMQLIKQIIKMPDKKDKFKIRKMMNIPDDTFVITSFGFISKTKLSEILAQGFLRFRKKYPSAKCRLIFVGELGTEYAMQLKTVLEGNFPIEITGYVDDETYHNYLYVSDLAIQLRGSSRGETSRAVLECLSLGLPVICNAYATANDYPDDVVYKIAEIPNSEDVANSIEELYSNTILRERYAKNGCEYVRKEHCVEIIAKKYAKFIHKIISDNQNTDLNSFICYTAKKIREKGGDTNLIRAIGRAYEQNREIANFKNVYITTENICIDEENKKYLYEKNIDILEGQLEGNKVNLVNFGGGDKSIEINDGDVVVIDSEQINENILNLVTAYRIDLFVCEKKTYNEFYNKYPLLQDYVMGTISNSKQLIEKICNL